MVTSLGYAATWFQVRKSVPYPYILGGSEVLLEAGLKAQSEAFMKHNPRDLGVHKTLNTALLNNELPQGI